MKAPMRTFLQTLSLFLLLALVSTFVLADETGPTKNVAATAPVAPKKVLMIGNSLTYTYGMPQILEGLATAGKQPLTITRHVTGGKGLDWHWDNASKPSNLTAPQRIAQGGFDLVILQGSGHGLRKQGGPEAFAELIPKYVQLIRDQKMTPMLYMAHPTAKQVDADALKPIIDGYNRVAKESKVACAPVTLAFVKFSEKYPEIALLDLQKELKYGRDKVATHPSAFGAYLAACTIYATIFDQSPVGLEFYAAFDAKTQIDIEPADAVHAQEIAWEVWQAYRKALTSPPADADK